MIICDICGNETTNYKKIPREHRDEDTNETCTDCYVLLKAEIESQDSQGKQNKKNNIRQFINQQKQSHGRGHGRNN